MPLSFLVPTESFIAVARNALSTFWESGSPAVTLTLTYECLQEPPAKLCFLPGLLRGLTMALSTKEFPSSAVLYPEAK